MSRTIRMADGDIFINSAGRSETVEGPHKAAQDIAECLMTPWDKERDWGSELADLNIPEPVSVFAGKQLVSKKVDEAIQRLRRYQALDPYAGPDELIEKIMKLQVDSLGQGTYVFWVSCMLEDEKITSDTILAVSLRHQESARYNRTIEETIRRVLGT